MQQISTFKDEPEKKLIPKYLKLEAQSIGALVVTLWTCYVLLLLLLLLLLLIKAHIA